MHVSTDQERCVFRARVRIAALISVEGLHMASFELGISDEGLHEASAFLTTGSQLAPPEYVFSYAGMSLAILKAPGAPSLGRSAKLVQNRSKPSGFAYVPDSLPF